MSYVAGGENDAVKVLLFLCNKLPLRVCGWYVGYTQNGKPEGVELVDIFPTGRRVTSLLISLKYLHTSTWKPPIICYNNRA